MVDDLTEGIGELYLPVVGVVEKGSGHLNGVREGRTADLDDFADEGRGVQVLINFQPIGLIVHFSNDYNI